MPFQELKHRLLQRKMELERQQVAIHCDFAQGLSANATEQAQERENEDVLTALADHNMTELEEINRALQRMELGTYNKCAHCGEAIKLARLNAVPFTVLCASCANTH